MYWYIIILFWNISNTILLHQVLTIVDILFSKVLEVLFASNLNSFLHLQSSNCDTRESTGNNNAYGSATSVKPNAYADAGRAVHFASATN